MMSNNLKLSRYLKIREKNGFVAIFHELHPDPVYCKKDEWVRFEKEIAEHSDDNLFRMLHKRFLLVASDLDDTLEFEEASVHLEQKLNQPTILYLMMAQECNLACKYCPFSKTAEKYGRNTMLSEEDAFAGINLWKNHLDEVYDSNKQYFIVFYGGEPLLNKKVIKKVLQYVEELSCSGKLIDKNLNFAISTNGILFDHQMIELCKEYNILVTVGLDGPTAKYNDFRVDPIGQETFDETVLSIKSLVKNGIRTCASVSITPTNVDQIKNYGEFFEGLGVEKFGFNFLKGRLLLESIPFEEVKDFYLKASKGIIENAKLQRKKNFEFQMEKKIVAFETGDFFPIDCTCYGNQIVIQPNGQISNCPFFRSELGHVRSINPDFRIWDTRVVKEWRRRLPLYYKGFRDMDSKSLCGGGCAWSSYKLNGSFLAIDEASKIFTQEVFNELIWSRFSY